MIKPPEEDRRKALIRAVMEALAQATSITAGLARLYQFARPSEMERLLDEWRRDVSNAINDHEAALQRLEDLLTPRLEIGETALALAVWIVEGSPDGLRTSIEFDEVSKAFPGIDGAALEEACFELKHLGLVSCTATMGHPVRTIRPDYCLFWAFDPVVTGTNPQTDAAQLAEIILQSDTNASAPKLLEATGWPKRRLNPAIARLIPSFLMAASEGSSNLTTRRWDLS